MTPNALLDCQDQGRLWPHPPGAVGGADLDAAYQQALAVRALRVARGERPVGYKIGFTNRTIWTRYNVFAPIWGPVWDSSVRHCDGSGTLSLAGTCQPRLEPEIVFGMRATPKAGATPDELFDVVEWLAPGFEVVQSHLPDWKFSATDTVADSALHARLLVGARLPLRRLAASAAGLDSLLAAAEVELLHDGSMVERGCGANVLDSPLQALHHFLGELRRCPGAPDLQPGDVVTTGTWTDAWPVEGGQTWTARFSAPLGALTVTLT
ncbi:MAG TPA: fumarylacetoacetate hydrolase family protein [Noviherbaspirillum sp.]|uniref:2-keto-4-pentenoate hydratase n=1 Tax=Noviherbaspirillum sp. TaxID=1926288 RepID=UPI002D5FF3B5|nr:fumarylacetoacetate hydrolase family protein [Noviherbaspirillum sp.]HYD94963.1 fumarylacetoacetate hydrolase family protein [Noviherbaspirillum sp.]